MVNISTPEAIATVPAPQTQPIANDESEPVASPTPMPLMEAFEFAAGGAVVPVQRVGNGVFKVVLVGDDSDLVAEIAAHFAQNTEAVPAMLSVWFVADIDPLERADVFREADSGFDGCAKNDGVARPFVSAESKLLRDLTDDAALVVLLEDGSNIIHNDACAQNQLSDRLASGLVEELNRLEIEDRFIFSPLPRVVGHYVDYLAGEGIAALTVALRDVEPIRFADALLDRIADEVRKDTVWMMDSTVGKWQLSEHSLIHPIAITQLNGLIYVLDSGRILTIDPTFTGGTFISVLQTGDEVDGVRVLELLDMATDGDMLFALDRAGDVYAFDGETWVVDRYDRPIRDRSAHYFVALDAGEEQRFLLETSAPLMLRFGEAEKRTNLPEAFHPVDVSVFGETAYVLLHDKESPGGEIRPITLGNDDGRLRINTPIVKPRQILATEESLFVLDYAGRRVQQFDRENGKRIAEYRFVDNRPISSLWTDGKTLILAARDALYLLGDGADSRLIDTGHLFTNNRPHDLPNLRLPVDFNIPIGIPRFTQRDYQMAGAPRHYRLGVHEGFDFYWQRGSQIQATASGTVIRADHNYAEPYSELFTQWRDQSFALGYTSAEAADFFGGRQVWIDHGAGIVTRYLHLSSIDPFVQVGNPVEVGQIIARVGNSGSPGSLEGPNEDTHLHFELRIHEGYLGQFLRPIEARTVLREILR